MPKACRGPEILSYRRRKAIALNRMSAFACLLALPLVGSACFASLQVRAGLSRERTRFRGRMREAVQTLPKLERSRSYRSPFGQAARHQVYACTTAGHRLLVLSPPGEKKIS